MGIVLKICLLVVGGGATLIALSGDAIDKSEERDEQRKSKLPKFNARGKLSIALLFLALGLGIVDAYLSDASEQEKIDRLIANGESLENTTTRLGVIKNGMETVSNLQSDALESLDRNEKQLAGTRKELEQNLDTTNDVLSRSQSIERNLMRLPRVLVNAKAPLDNILIPLPKAHAIKSGNIFRFSIVSPDGLSSMDLKDKLIQIRLGRQVHRVTELTGEVIAGGVDGELNNIIVENRSKLNASISYTIYEIEP